MSRGMSRGGGFPIIIAVLGVLIVAVIGIFLYMQFSGDPSESSLNNGGLPTPIITPENTPMPTLTPSPSPDPTQEVQPTVPTTDTTPDAATTATPTPAPARANGTGYVNVSGLKVHAHANFTSDTVERIPYGTQVQGEMDGKWMAVTYDGESGWIYTGRISDEDKRYCVVSSQGSLVDLLPDPTAEVEVIIKEFKDATIAAGLMTVPIEFKEGVYTATDGTGVPGSACFSVTGGTFIVKSGNTAGTTYITLEINPTVASGGNVVVTVKSQKLFNLAGEACKTGSRTYVLP